GFDAPTPEGYGTQMVQWLAQVQNGSLLMCHPATTEVVGDAIGAQRPVEFAYLMSDAFGALLQAQQCQIQQGPLMPLLKLVLAMHCNITANHSRRRIRAICWGEIAVTAEMVICKLGGVHSFIGHFFTSSTLRGPQRL